MLLYPLVLGTLFTVFTIVVSVWLFGVLDANAERREAIEAEVAAAAAAVPCGPSAEALRHVAASGALHGVSLGARHFLLALLVGGSAATPFRFAGTCEATWLAPLLFTLALAMPRFEADYILPFTSSNITLKCKKFCIFYFFLKYSFFIAF